MKRSGAYPVYLFMTAVSAFLFSTAFTTSALYRFQMVGLDPLELVLLGTTLEISIFVFEIPTGIVADLVSRRLSVIIGYTLIGSGMLLEGSFQIFATILLAQAVWGIGYTFISGAIDAWMADEMGEENLAAIYLRGSQFAEAASFAGIILNVFLAGMRLYYPFLFGGTGHILLALILLAFMPENNFHPTPQGERNTWQKMGHIFREGVQVIRQRPLLTTIIGLTFFYGLYSEPLDRLWEALILDNFTLPDFGNFDVVIWFGIIKGVVMLLAIATTEYARRKSKTLSNHRFVLLLAIITSVIALGMILFGLSTSFLMAIIVYIVVAVVRANLNPLFSAWINRGIPSGVRATVLSTFGQMDAIGQTVGGPAIGVVASRVSLRAAMVLSGVLLSPTVLLYRRAYRLESEENLPAIE